MDYNSVVLADGPDALFRLNEASGTIIQDFQTGQLLTLSLLPGGAVGYQQPGLIADIDTAMHFDLAGAQGIVPLVYSLAVSIEGWFQSDVSVSNEQIIWSNYFSSVDWSFQLMAVDFGGQIKLLINTAAGVVELSATGIIFTDGGVYHFVVSYDGNTVILYINGVQRGTVSGITLLDSITDAFTIGNRYTPTEVNSFNGWIDEIALYNYALPLSRVVAHYEGGTHSVLPTLGYPDAMAATLPVAYWRLGDAVASVEAVDEVGNINATLIGPVVLGVAGGLAGDADTAISMPDKTAYGSAQSLVLDMAGDFTLSLWVNFDVINPTGGTDLQQTMIAKRTNGISSLTEYVLDLFGGNLRFIMNTSAIISSTLLLDSIWYFIVAVRSGSTGSIYIDGALDIQGPVVAQISNPRPVGIGAPVDFGFEIASVRGTLDEVAIHNKALTLIEIQSLYNSGITPPLVGDDTGGVFASTINL